jgi:type I restriction enzyme S subunit
MQLKRTVDCCVNGIWGEEPRNDGSDTIVIRVADFDRQGLSIKEDGYTYRRIEEKEKQNRKLKRGDLLLEKSGGGEKTLVGQVVLFDKDFDAVTSNFVAKMSPLEAFDGRYLNYVFSRFYFENLNSCSIKQNTGIQNLDSAAYLSEKIGMPSKEEQQKIANFLDHETAKIDTLIAKQQDLIKLLKEKRQAVISHAVTKGLNPNAPMRDSGVEWLGEVPANWEITRAKFVSEIFIPQRNKPELNELTGVAWATMEDMKKPYISQTKNFVSDEAAKFSGSKILVAGSVIASCVGNFGIASINSIDVVINQQLQAFIPRKIKAEFLREIISISKSYFELIGTAATLVYVNQQGFENLPVVVPPISEQEKICSLILEKSLKFDELISQCETAIEFIQERRTALISSAVTGKIDVRDVEISAKECCS